MIIIWVYKSWDCDENKKHILPLFAFVWLSRKAVTVECTERPKKLNTWINRSLRSEIWVLIYLLSLSLVFYFNVQGCFLKSPLPLLYFQQDSCWSLHIWRSCEKCKWNVITQLAWLIVVFKPGFLTDMSHAMMVAMKVKVMTVMTVVISLKINFMWEDPQITGQWVAGFSLDFP